MKKRIFMLAALAAGLVLCLAACGETNGDPITVTLWHVYGGEVNSPMNALVEEFNRTVGQEQGIRVRVDSVSNSGSRFGKIVSSIAWIDCSAPPIVNTKPILQETIVAVIAPTVIRPTVLAALVIKLMMPFSAALLINFAPKL